MHASLADTPTDDGRRGANAAAVLRAILDHGPVARSTVGRLTGLSTAAISRQCADLADLGLVQERPVRRTRPAVGRPHVPVDIDTRTHLVGGLHIAVAHATYVLMDLRGRILARQRVPHAETSPAAVLADTGTRMAEFLAEHSGTSRPLGVGVATGGWVDPARGVVVRHGRLGWSDVPARDVLEQHLGVPVRVESHSRALARAEQLIGAHRDRARSSMVHLFVGNVVDAAIATGGVVHHGPRSAAGNVSHLPVGAGLTLAATPCGCARTGCFAATVASRAVAENAAASGSLPRPDFAAALEALDDGAPWALELFRDRARLVGRAVATLLDVINPEILVVVEAGVVRRPGLLTVMHDEIARRSHIDTDVREVVVAGSFGTDVLGVAAGSIALHDTFAHPLDGRLRPAVT